MQRLLDIFRFDIPSASTEPVLYSAPATRTVLQYLLYQLPSSSILIGLTQPGRSERARPGDPLYEYGTVQYGSRVKVR